MEMEMETKSGASSEAMSKKLWKLVRVVLLMAKKGFAKSKLLLDVALLFKRSHKLAGKTLQSLILPSSSSSNDAVRDYEFSCRNSPAFPFLHLPKRSKPSSLLHFNRRHSAPQLDEANTMAAVQRVLETINADGEAVQSPAVTAPRWSSQLRITDSPFPMKENEEEAVQVNKAADDFINMFYSNLRMQKSTAVDSPYHDTSASSIRQLPQI